jgi:hypothetical protein
MSSLPVARDTIVHHDLNVVPTADRPKGPRTVAEHQAAACEALLEHGSGWLREAPLPVT